MVADSEFQYPSVMDADLIQDISQILTNMPLKMENIIERISRLATTPHREEIVTDLRKWLQDKQI